MLPTRLLASILSISALVVVACTPQAPPGALPSGAGPERPTAPKRVTAGILGNPPTISNKINSPGAGGIVAGAAEMETLLNAGLASEDEASVLRPQLAEAVPSIESGLWKVFPDGRMETTWRLRAGVQWHDSAPFTAEDILFTVQVWRDRELPIFRSSAVDSVEAAEAVDAQTARILWKAPYIYADTLFSGALLPRHLLERTYQESKATLHQLPYWNEEFVGTGPFRLREWVRDSHVVLLANDRYILGRPGIDELEVKFFTDSNALVANILAGAVQLTLGRALSIEQALQVRERWKEGRMGLPASFTWIVIYPQFISPSPSVVANLQFRQALMHALDRQGMADSIQAGLVSVAHSYLNPREPESRAIEAGLVRYEYDVRKAEQMIQELGLGKGPDGIFRESGSQRLEVEIRTTGGEDIHEKSLYAVADSWQRVGVAVEPVVIPQARTRDPEYRAIFPAFQVLQQPNRTSSLSNLHGSRIPVPENRFSGGNKPRYQNAELDALIDRYFVTIPTAERTEVLGQITRHISEQLPMMGLFYNVQPSMIGNRLVNIGEGKPNWNSYAWDVAS